MPLFSSLSRSRSSIDLGDMYLLMPGASINANLNPQETDWFDLELMQGQRIEIQMTSSAVDSVMDLYQGSTLLTSDDDSGGQRNALLSFTAPGSATYRIAAHAFDGATYGAYTLSALLDVAADGMTDATLALGTPVAGVIGVAGDEDWFRMTLTAGMRYTLALQGAPSGKGTLADPLLAGIHDAQGVLLDGTVNDDLGASMESEVTFIAPTSGTYFVSASAFGTSVGTYTLTLTASTVVDVAADTTTTAQVAMGAVYNGRLEVARDVDWIRVQLTAGQTYVLELDGDRGSATPLTDPVLVGIHDSTGKLIEGTGNDDYGIGYNAQVTFQAPTTGTYYVGAAGYDTLSGDYTLRLLSTTNTTDQQTASTATTGRLEVNAAATASRIDFARDVDWFAVSLEAGQDYRIQMRGADSNAGTLADPEIVGVMDAQGVLIAGTGNNDQPGTLDAATTFRAGTDGTFYVGVRAANDGVGTYLASVEKVAASTDTPANTTTTVSAQVGTPLTGLIETAGDVDWIKVDLVAGTAYRFDLRVPTAPSTGDSVVARLDPLFVGLYDAHGVAVPGSCDDDSGGNGNAQVSVTPTASGTYYAAVAGYGQTAGAYELSVVTGSVDLVAPTLVSSNPVEGDKEVLPGANLTLEFSEAIQAGTGQITLTGGGVTRSIAVTDATQVRIDGQFLSINPTTDLSANTDYTLTLSQGAVRDLAGNAFAGLATAGLGFHTTGGVVQDTWTVMVYVAADNDLEPFSLGDLNEMEQVVLPGSVNVFTMVDRAAGYDTSNGNWTDTRVGAITSDADTNTFSSALVSIGERNMGQSATLTDLINRAVAARPADHYALIVWDHGGGLPGTSWDDASSGDNLTLSEMRSAVEASNVTHFDLIGFDACLQGMVEQAWDLRNLTDVVVASQELEPGDGWEYQNFLDDLAADPNLNATQLARAIVDAYGVRYAGEDNTTLAASRTSALGALATTLDAFVAATIAAGSSVVAALRTAAQRTTAIDGGSQDYRDLGDFMQQVRAAVNVAAIDDAALAVQQALGHVVLTHVGTVAGANGLSVYLPLQSINDRYDDANLSFLQSTSWDDFLRFMLADASGDALLGDDQANTLRGFDGMDTLVGNGGADSLEGGNGNDSLDGGVGNDTLDGGAGRDTLVGGDGDDTYRISQIDDVVTEANAAAAGGVDRVYVLFNQAAGASPYVLPTRVEQVSILATGTSHVSGNELDNLIVAGLGVNSIDGGAGNDTLSYSGVPAGGVGVTLNLGATDAAGWATAAGGSAADRVRGIEHLSGSRLADRFTGQAGANRLTGAEGNDTLDGAGGNDTLDGGAGADSLVGGDGNDSLLGGAGNDTLAGGTGAADKATFGGDHSVIDLATGRASGATEGVDTLSGIEVVDGGSGNDTLTGSGLADTLLGGAGNDSLVGNSGNDSLSGGDGNDTLTGGAGNDTLAGGSGVDRVVLGGDSAIINLITGLAIGSTEGTDSLSGNEWIDAGAGNDTIFGAGIAETLVGGTGNDSLVGNSGNDSLSGGDGNDTLSGGAGNDTLAGGNGLDRAVFGGDNGTINLITGQAGGATEGTDSLSSIEWIDAGAGNDTITGAGIAETLAGGAGNDSLIGNSGNDSLSGGDGADILSGGAGNDILDGGLGMDRVNFGADHSFIDLGIGRTLLVVGGTEGSDALLGIEIVDGGAGNDTVVGGAASENLLGNTGNDSLSGGDGNDSLSGGDGQDVLLGGNHADLLNGGAGNDTLTGGAGSDLFRFDMALSAATNVDRVTDFNAADDTVMLENSVFGALTVTGVLGAGLFVANTAGRAMDADDRIIYDTDGGQLYYDADGSGAGAAVLFATLAAGLTLTAGDFVVT